MCVVWFFGFLGCWLVGWFRSLYIYHIDDHLTGHYLTISPVVLVGFFVFIILCRRRSSVVDKRYRMSSLQPL